MRTASSPFVPSPLTAALMVSQPLPSVSGDHAPPGARRCPARSGPVPSVMESPRNRILSPAWGRSRGFGIRWSWSCRSSAGWGDTGCSDHHLGVRAVAESALGRDHEDVRLTLPPVPERFLNETLAGEGSTRRPTISPSPIATSEPATMSRPLAPTCFSVGRPGTPARRGGGRPGRPRRPVSDPAGAPEDDGPRRVGDEPLCHRVQVGGARGVGAGAPGAWTSRLNHPDPGPPTRWTTRRWRPDAEGHRGAADVVGRGAEEPDHPVAVDEDGAAGVTPEDQDVGPGRSNVPRSRTPRGRRVAAGSTPRHPEANWRLPLPEGSGCG